MNQQTTTKCRKPPSVATIYSRISHSKSACGRRWLEFQESGKVTTAYSLDSKWRTVRDSSTVAPNSSPCSSAKWNKKLEYRLIKKSLGL
jgi:nuclear transport factor 2 (NTF2) superfamily protein